MVYSECGNQHCVENYLTCYDKFFQNLCANISDECEPKCVCEVGYVLDDNNECVQDCKSCYTELGQPIPLSTSDPAIAEPCQTW